MDEVVVAHLRMIERARNLANQEKEKLSLAIDEPAVVDLDNASMPERAPGFESCEYAYFLLKLGI